MKKTFKLAGGLGALLVGLALLPFVQAAPPAAGSADKSAEKLLVAQKGNADISIYGNSFAQVQERRRVHLSAGVNRVQLEGISSKYVADSFHFVKAENAGDVKPGKVSFKTATYEAPTLTGNESVLQAAVGKEIRVLHQPSGEYLKGKLLSASNGQLVLASANGEARLLPGTDVALDALPDGLSASAVLVLEVECSAAGTYDLTFMYDTTGLEWSARHVAVLDDEKSVITNWQTVVSINNQTGANYGNATVRLLSAAALGDGNDGRMYRAESARSPVAPGAAMMVEEVGDQKVFNLPGKLALKSGQSRQILLVEANDVPVTRTYFVPAGNYAAAKPMKASVRLSVENCDKHNLGKDLPAGQVKIFQANSAGVLQRTGGAYISEKSVNETFDMVIGTANDIKFTRTLASSTREADPKSTKHEFLVNVWDVKVFNFGAKRDVAVVVEVGTNVNTTIDQGGAFSPRNANQSDAQVKVARKSDSTVRYTLRTRVVRPTVSPAVSQ